MEFEVWNGVELDMGKSSRKALEKRSRSIIVRLPYERRRVYHRIVNGREKRVLVSVRGVLEMRWDEK
jgi:hypothetical protein